MPQKCANPSERIAYGKVEGEVVSPIEAFEPPSFAFLQGWVESLHS
jgi:hypothetical protein